MPNHWETSARPLFVKTVFVNGNRHAILFEKDPLLRCGNSPYKKTSRPNSSMSFASDLSISFSESQGSAFEGKSFKLRTVGQKQQKDLTSELQSCLVKLKLASGSLDSQTKPTPEKCTCNSKDLNGSQGKGKGNSKQKRHKWNHEKICKRKQREQLYVEPEENKSAGRKNSRDNSCFVYNLENYRGKKKYCFVKISSQPPQFVLNCCCEKTWNETHTRNPTNKNNLVISATIHNLVMTSSYENLLHKTFDYIVPLENSELHWNNYLTKSYYNSLSERVFQWLDLARKRKTQKQKSNSIDEDDSPSNDTERLFSGKRFVGDIKKAECSYKQETDILINQRIGKFSQNEGQEEVEGEVIGEPHVETLLSTDKLNLHDHLTEKNTSARTLDKPVTGSQMISEKVQNNENFSGISIPIKSNSSGANLTVSSLKIQDLMLNYIMNETSNFRNLNKKKIKESRTSSTHQNKHKETYSSDEGKEFTTMPMNDWEKKINERTFFLDRIDGSGKRFRCQYERNFDEYADGIKNPISTDEFTERNQKSINNLNITQTRPVLVQNLLSPQQPDKLSYLQEEKIVWASEKNTGRPQLHIFMPSVLRKDQSDDSMSECESFLNS